MAENKGTVKVHGPSAFGARESVAYNYLQLSFSHSGPWINTKSLVLNGSFMKT